MDLERVQKNALRLIMGENYSSYDESLEELQLENLGKHLSTKFAMNCVENEKTKHLFPLKNKIHKPETRREEKYKVINTKTRRLQRSTVPYLQKLMNEYERDTS